jgi:hypothetical protein
MRYVNFYNTRTDYKSMQSVDYFGDLVGMCEDPSRGGMYIGIGNVYADITGGVHYVKFRNEYESLLGGMGF